MHKQKTTKLFAGFASIACFCLAAIMAICIMLPAHKAAADESTLNDISFSSEVDIFKQQYENTSGDITVKSVGTDCVVAPGTSNIGKFTITNNQKEDIKVDITFKSPFSEEGQAALPLQIKIIDPDGNYIFGSATEWANPAELEGKVVTMFFDGEETKEFEVPWQWPYSSSNDALDTQYGKQSAEGITSLEFKIAFDVTEHKEPSPGPQPEPEPTPTPTPTPENIEPTTNGTSATADFLAPLLIVFLVITAATAALLIIKRRKTSQAKTIQTCTHKAEQDIASGITKIRTSYIVVAAIVVFALVACIYSVVNATIMIGAENTGSARIAKFGTQVETEGTKDVELDLGSSSGVSAIYPFTVKANAEATSKYSITVKFPQSANIPAGVLSLTVSDSATTPHAQTIEVDTSKERNYTFTDDAWIFDVGAEGNDTNADAFTQNMTLTLNGTGGTTLITNTLQSNGIEVLVNYEQVD